MQEIKLRLLLEEFEERAAIMEYDSGLTREEAEIQAYLTMKGIENEVDRFRQILLETADKIRGN
jgi:hypothetical protein